jgi:sialic acid synthase SpsE
MQTIELPNGRKIGRGEPCFIVAEIGQNHQGDVDTAVRLLKMAHEAGVDAVKLCKRDINSDLTRAAQLEPYTGPQSFGATYGEHRRALELTAKDYGHLKDRMRCNDWPEILFSTVCDQKSADEMAAAIDPPLYKIASRDLDNLPLLEHVARFGKPMIVSTGMACDFDEIDAAVETIWQHHKQLCLLYCVSEYPTPIERLDLNIIRRFRQRYNVIAGLSDHTPGIVAAQAAATLGACIIEKHITLARAMKGTDHAASLEADGITKLVRNIRLTETMKQPKPFEPGSDANRSKLGRSLVAARTIHPCEIIGEADVCLKSPGTGVRWADRGKVIGQQARTQISADTTLHASDVMTPENPIHYPA